MWQELLPHALAVGVPYEVFWHLTPKKIRAFYDAYRMKREIQDEQMWVMGSYVLSAVSVAIEHCLAGKKARSEYLKQPLLQGTKADSGQLSESELQRQRELFVAKLGLMKSNFELAKENKEKR